MVDLKGYPREFISGSRDCCHILKYQTCAQLQRMCPEMPQCRQSSNATTPSQYSDDMEAAGRLRRWMMPGEARSRSKVSPFPKRFINKMMRIITMLALMTAQARAAGAWPPSCLECTADVEAARAQWQQVAPSVFADLPNLLCRDSSLPTVCSAGVTGLLKAWNQTVADANSTEICAAVGLCGIDLAVFDDLALPHGDPAWL